MTFLSAPTESLVRRSARAVYDPGRWPGRAIWPLLRGLPAVLGAGACSREYERLERRTLLMLCVYRRRNADLVESLIRGCVMGEFEARLWALDQVSPKLAQWTVGQGPGLRCSLLNGLWGASETEPDWVILVDDDVELLNGWSLPSFVGAMSRLDVDFAQPAHELGSNHSHGFNLRRPLIAGRSVASVEIGPLVAIRSPWHQQVLPFPDDAGMGFYLEWSWAALAQHGCRSAVLDAVPMRHLGSIGTEYDVVSAGSSRHRDGSGAMSLDDLNRGYPAYGRFLWPRLRRQGSRGA